MRASARRLASGWRGRRRDGCCPRGCPAPGPARCGRSSPPRGPSAPVTRLARAPTRRPARAERRGHARPRRRRTGPGRGSGSRPIFSASVLVSSTSGTSWAPSMAETPNSLPMSISTWLRRLDAPSTSDSIESCSSWSTRTPTRRASSAASAVAWSTGRSATARRARARPRTAAARRDGGGLGAAARRARARPPARGSRCRVLVTCRTPRRRRPPR